MFGLEVSDGQLDNIDYLLYGLTPDDILNSSELFCMNQKELFDYCCGKNILLYQAHPFRKGTFVQNPLYLHGIEINCHPLYKTNEKERVFELASMHGLKVSCGSDFHGDTYKPCCGMIIPDDINDSVHFAEYIRQQQANLLIHDIINLE